MGAVYICPKNIPVPQEVKHVFRRKGFGAPDAFELGNHRFLLYSKQLFDSINRIDIAGSTLLIIGTCFYRDMSYEAGLHRILSDFTAGRLNQKHLFGSFVLFFWHNGQIHFMIDKAGVQNLFFNKASGVISTSFIACIIGTSAINGKTTLNKNALAEVLITGNLIGPETLVKQVERFELRIHHSLPGMGCFNDTDSRHEHPQLQPCEDFGAEVGRQLDVIHDYFVALKSCFAHFGVVSGLTAGLDSRLLALMLNKHVADYQLYTTNRKPPATEIAIARELAAALGKNIILPDHKTFAQIPQDQYIEMMRENMFFNDGLIRTHNLWTEEIKSRNYISGLFSGGLINMTGVGGEQYRNSDFLAPEVFPFSQWIFDQMIHKFLGDPFVNRKSKETIVGNIAGKISALTGINGSRNTLSLFQIRRFQNEVYNPANRTIRNNVENQLAFCLSPFTEFNISQKACEAFACAGKHFGFEKEMISTLNPKVASIETGYGFSPDRRTPVKYDLLYHFKQLTGPKLFNSLNRTAKLKQKSVFREMLSAHPALKSYTEALESLMLPIDLQKIKKSNFLSPLLIEAGLFLNEFAGVIDHD